jgi:AraC-like DNA-binding protein
MHSVSLEDIRAAIEAGLRGRGAASHLIARNLSCSESTLHRTLRRNGTSFAAERNRIRVTLALEGLKAGLPIARVARAVEVTPDYLRRLVVAQLGITPVNIMRAALLADELGKLPQTFAELRRRLEAERQLDALVGDLPAHHPLAPWAKELMQRAYLPEVETEEFYARLRRRHQHDRAARRDESDLRRLENGRFELSVPESPREFDEFERIQRSQMFAGWRRRLHAYRQLRR